MAILREMKLDPITWDIAFENGNIVFLEGKEAVAQRIAVEIKTLLTEWRFDELIGVPWLQSILGQKGTTVAMVRQVLYNAISAVQGVDRIITMTVEIDRATRALSVSGFAQAGGDEIAFSADRPF